MMELISLFLAGLVAGGLVVFLAARLYWRRLSTAAGDKKSSPYITYREFSSNLASIIDDLAQFCREHPALTHPYLILGNLYRLQGQAHRSVVIRQNLLTEESLPKNMRDRVRIELASDLMELGLEEQAVQSLNEVAQGSQLYAMAQERLAELYQKRQDFESAFNCMQKVFERQRNWRNRKRTAYFAALHAEKMLSEGDLPSSQRFVQRALSFDEECILAVYTQGRVLVQEKDFDAAITAFTRMLEINENYAFLAVPQIEEAYYGKQSFMRLGDQLQSLWRRFPQNPYLAYSIGKFFRKKKFYEDARRSLNQALEINPTYIPARQELLNLNSEESQPSEVSEDYQNFLEELKATKKFVCHFCQTRHETMMWYCPACGRWESVYADLYLLPSVVYAETPLFEHQASHS